MNELISLLRWAALVIGFCIFSYALGHTRGETDGQFDARLQFVERCVSIQQKTPTKCNLIYTAIETAVKKTE